ncbi:electron transfer flavoprotein subunit alpha/FixB family protein [Occallatibacter savannae]|uniref:electron transfer flavoprotein subunit alpha/FixB family protein n=1 Tax=Occallatibacter savannae TaxID=1002691 RepID=UPI000D69BA9D|nr:FAD-binding protein [Occallatibacter savannae]
MAESILVLTHADETGRSLTKLSMEVVSAGKDLAARLDAHLAIGILAVDSVSAAGTVGGIGAPVFGVSDEAFAQARYGTDIAGYEALYRAVQPTIILAPQSSRMARVAAGLAHRIGGKVDTHITAIRTEGGLEVSRWLYRQRIETVITRSERPWVLTFEAGVYPPFEGTGGDVVVEPVAVELPPKRTKVIGVRAPAQAAQTIRPDARMLFVAGAGWTKKQADGQTHALEAGELILGFLQKTGASLGSSKSLVDQGGDGQPVLPFLTHMNQVGQTGSTPRHAKGLATCCHGEEPHVVGWRFIGDRRAISLDPNCGWARGKADVVYVADAFKVLAKVNELLGSRR